MLESKLKPSGKLGVIDFGCIKVFPDQFIKSCIRLVQKHLNSSHQEFLNELVYMGFIKNGSNQSAKEKKIERLFSNLAKILGSIYQKSIFDFGNHKFREDLINLFQNAMEIREVRGSEQFIFFNRITFGLMSILMKLEAKIETDEAREIILNSDC